MQQLVEASVNPLVRFCLFYFLSFFLYFISPTIHFFFRYILYLSVHNKLGMPGQMKSNLSRWIFISFSNIRQYEAPIM